ncbi:MAG: pantoate--beta-alanine ligase [Verrucomicrobiota bacterium]
MHIAESIEALKATPMPGPVVLVPTMGALHEGHLSLVRDARAVAGSEGTVVVSVFVNPTQFGPNEDFEAYPRDPEGDRAKCEAAGASVVFEPTAEEMYPPGDSTDVQETALSQFLCGASRPVHFAGVCRVVLKLFNIVRPNIAVFGKKDYQQLAIIRRMVRDLHLPIEIHGGETVREPDGLAMSSRNLYLEPREREEAAGIRSGLLLAKELFDRGEREVAMIKADVALHLAKKSPLGKIDYLEIVDLESFSPVEKIENGALMAAAVFFGKTRLIDNMELGGNR